jgi:hypothetical protein
VVAACQANANEKGGDAVECGAVDTNPVRENIIVHQMRERFIN